jgi:hypothetical protein
VGMEALLHIRDIEGAYVFEAEGAESLDRV